MCETCNKGCLYVYLTWASVGEHLTAFGKSMARALRALTPTRLAATSAVNMAKFWTVDRMFVVVFCSFEVTNFLIHFVLDCRKRVTSSPTARTLASMPRFEFLPKSLL